MLHFQKRRIARASKSPQLLLAAWGTADADADVNNDGTVNAADLSLLLDTWGACNESPHEARTLPRPTAHEAGNHRCMALQRASTTLSKPPRGELVHSQRYSRGYSRGSSRGHARWRSAHRLLALSILIASCVTLVLFVMRSEHVRASVSVLCAFLVIELFTIYGKRRSVRSAAAPGESVHEQRTEEQRLRDTRRRIGFSISLRIVVVLALAGALLASLALEVRFLAIGALIAFLGLALFGGSAWLAAVGDEEEYSEETRNTDDRSRSLKR